MEDKDFELAGERPGCLQNSLPSNAPTELILSTFHQRLDCLSTLAASGMNEMSVIAQHTSLVSLRRREVLASLDRSWSAEKLVCTPPPEGNMFETSAAQVREERGS